MNKKTLTFLIPLSLFFILNFTWTNLVFASQSKIEYIDSFWVHCYTGSKKNSTTKRTYIGSEEIRDIGGEILDRDYILDREVFSEDKTEIKSKKVFSLTTRLMLNTNDANMKEHRIDPIRAKSMLFLDLFSKANRIAQTCIKMASLGSKSYLVTDIRISKSKFTPKSSTMPLVVYFDEKGLSDKESTELLKAYRLSPKNAENIEGNKFTYHIDQSENSTLINFFGSFLQDNFIDFKKNAPKSLSNLVGEKDFLIRLCDYLIAGERVKSKKVENKKIAMQYLSKILRQHEPVIECLLEGEDVIFLQKGTGVNSIVTMARTSFDRIQQNKELYSELLENSSAARELESRKSQRLILASLLKGTVFTVTKIVQLALSFLSDNKEIVESIGPLSKKLEDFINLQVKKYNEQDVKCMATEDQKQDNFIKEFDSFLKEIKHELKSDGVNQDTEALKNAFIRAINDSSEKINAKEKEEETGVGEMK